MHFTPCPKCKHVGMLHYDKNGKLVADPKEGEVVIKECPKCGYLQ